MESAYTRFTGIGGTPLRDGYHFSQTLVNDFGRPYGQGANAISGLATGANAGPFTLYFRGEYQYASQLPMSIYSTAAQNALVADDRLPFGWNLRFGNTNRLRPIEAYVSVNLHDWQLTFGQQSLWCAGSCCRWPRCGTMFGRRTSLVSAAEATKNRAGGPDHSSPRAAHRRLGPAAARQLLRRNGPPPNSMNHDGGKVESKTHPEFAAASQTTRCPVTRS